MDLDALIAGMQAEPTYQWAWQNHTPTLLHLAKQLGAAGEKPHVMEIGGGRHPLFSPDEISNYCTSYTVNDISAEELAQAPEYLHKAQFDIATKDASQLPSYGYDLIFSKMVFEHIVDAGQAYRNCYQLLKPGGVAMHFLPTLFCPPFVINLFLPEILAEKILTFFFPARNRNEHPKFPAYYDWSYSTQKNLDKIRTIGFSDVAVVPFYGHGYFDKIPVVKQCDALLSKWARARDVRALTSYAYIVVRK